MGRPLSKLKWKMYEILREIQQGHKETPKEIQKSIEIAGFQEVFPSFRRFSVPFFFHLPKRAVFSCRRDRIPEEIQEGEPPCRRLF